MLSESRWQLASARSSLLIETSCLASNYRARGGRAIFSFPAFGGAKPAVRVGSGVCRGVGEPGAGRGAWRRNGAAVRSGTPGGEAIVLGPVHPQVHSLRPKTQRQGEGCRQLSGGTDVECPLSEAGDPHPAAHQLSHGEPPLALPSSPVARVGRQEVSPQQLLGQKAAQGTATVTRVSALSRVLLLSEEGSQLAGQNWASHCPSLGLNRVHLASG